MLSFIQSTSRLRLQTLDDQGIRYAPVTDVRASILDLRGPRKRAGAERGHFLIQRIKHQPRIRQFDCLRNGPGKDNGISPSLSSEKPLPSMAPHLHHLMHLGDRGTVWRTFINASHVINDEFHDHGPDCRPIWHRNEPYKFAFGKSKCIAESDLAEYLRIS